MSSNPSTYTYLEGYKLDKLAAHATRPIAAAFAREGWLWRGSEEPPSEALIAVTIRRMLGEVELDCTLGTGRINVSRWIDDGEEHAQVWLDVASWAAEDADPS